MPFAVVALQPAMSYTFEQFIRFTTDAVGLERTFRLFQAVVQILSSFALPFDLLIYGVGLTAYGPPSPAATRVILLALRQRLALARRFFRVFRFLESFNGAQKLYATVSAAQGPKGPAKPAWVHSDVWLDIFGRTFNGMYLLLEASTMVDALKIDGLAIWTPEWEHRITVEGQRFWLFSLVCGVVSGTVKMLKVLAYTPVPTVVEGNLHGKQEGDAAQSEPEKTLVRGENESQEDWDLKREQERLRGIVKGRKQGRVAWRREIRQKIHKLGRGVIANALDVTLPGSVVGWIQVDTGTVGVAMFITTILTSMDVWERCGQEIARSAQVG
ncbi:peroxisomal biogenesis factor 11 [Biscogniauxia sp. FL1348]|nr:peroxisomal biogenesis factor 11 [Biscogniauxia sp. FL1348]